jgi:hypothetical protein
VKKANQSQTDTDMEDRNYDAPKERAPRLDLRRDSAPVRDKGDEKDAIKKREDLGGTSVYKKKLDSAKSVKPKNAQEQQSDQASGRNVAGFKPTPENFENLCKIEAKLDVCLKFLSQAMHEFYALKSIDISPDGKLGGRGFILEIPEIRARLHAAVENISGLIDTVYDETRGKHWDFSAPEEEQPEAPMPESEPGTNDDYNEESNDFAKVSSIISQVRKKAEGGE